MLTKWAFEISIRKGHTYRIVVSDLERRRAIWFGGKDRSEESMDEFFAFLGDGRTKRVRLAVMDMWKPFRNSTNKRAPQAAILFDKFHILRHLGEALDKVRKQEYAKLDGQKRKFIKGQKYALLSHKENLEGTARKNLKILLAANKRLNTAYVLEESFGQLWDYKSEAWARKFFDNWRDQLKWQRLKPYEKFAEMIDAHWDGIAAYCKPENKVETTTLDTGASSFGSMGARKVFSGSPSLEQLQQGHPPRPPVAPPRVRPIASLRPNPTTGRGRDRSPAS